MIDGSSCGSSTTNSVRCAGKRCSLISTGLPARSVVTRRHFSSGAPVGTASNSASAGVRRIGTDRLGGAAELDVEQLVERRAFDVVHRQLLPEFRPGTTR